VINFNRWEPRARHALPGMGAAAAPPLGGVSRRDRRNGRTFERAKLRNRFAPCNRNETLLPSSTKPLGEELADHLAG
jgi:hypothetical protein